jgi:hypothetical protein
MAAPKKRWLLRITDGWICTWEPQAAKRTDMKEISEAEAMARLEGKPIPKSVTNIPQDIIDTIDSFTPEKRELLRQAMAAIEDGAVQPKDGALAAPPEVPPVPETATETVVETSDNVAVPPETVETPEGAQTNTGEPQLKDDEDMTVSDDSLKKPLSNMNKGRVGPVRAA